MTFAIEWRFTMAQNPTVDTEHRPRKFWYRFGLIALLFLLTVYILAQIYVVLTVRRLHYKNFALIREGMTKEEVETILGGPPGNYGDHPRPIYNSLSVSRLKPTLPINRTWSDDYNRIDVYFDAEDRVVDTYVYEKYYQPPPKGQGFVPWLKQLLGL